MGEIAHRFHGGAAVGLVEPFERLVKREQGKVRAQRSCERAPPPHPAGELRGGNGETVRKPEPGEHFARLALFFPSGGKLYDAKAYLEIADLFAWTAVIVAVSALFERVFLFLLGRIFDALEHAV